MLQRLEDRNGVNAVDLKEAELRRHGFFEGEAHEIPQHREYRRFEYQDGPTVTHVIEWEDEAPVGTELVHS